MDGLRASSNHRLISLSVSKPPVDEPAATIRLLVLERALALALAADVGRGAEA
jgi:hypothetical protein